MSMWRSAAKSFALVLALGGIVLGVYYVLFVRPFDMAESEISQSGAELTESPEGLLTLTWPAADKADAYLVELASGGETLWSAYADTTRIRMPEAVGGEKLTLTVTPMVSYETPKGDYYRPGDKPLTAEYPAKTPSFEGLRWTVDPNNDTLTVTWDTVPGGTYTVLDGSGRSVAVTSSGEAVIAFGGVPAPAKGETASFTLTCGLEGYGVRFKSERTATVEVMGDELLDTVLSLEVKDRGNNIYDVAWNETGGERYELEYRLGNGKWTSVGSFTDSDGRSCVIGPLEPFEDYDIRVSALGGIAGEDGAEVTQGFAEVTTGSTVMYATIWVTKNLDVWADTSKTVKVGTAVTDKSYCVMGEENGFFLIYLDGAKGWVDSTYCLINLPDFMGGLVRYDIKNSYDSIYMAHDYGIPGITGTVITGYEEVGLSYATVTRQETVRSEEPQEEPGAEAGPKVGEDTQAGAYDGTYELKDVEKSEPGEFLVPLLYPTAKKVMAAALEARRDGYELKIYDAFRPYIATRFLYDLTEGLLRDEVPEYVYREMAGQMWEDYLVDLDAPEEPEGGVDAPETTGTPDADTGAGMPEDEAVPEDGGDISDTQPEEREPRPSYYDVITDGRYSLSAFLAKGGSMHNLGVAVDLTLTWADTGEELEMQSAMHDLSWNSVLGKNNESADLLAKYMTGANLGTLTSEWWHFQDDELRSAVKDLPRRQNGVTSAGWMFDGRGWRYRTDEGEFLRDGTFKVDSSSYTFDASGYAPYAGWEKS